MFVLRMAPATVAAVALVLGAGVETAQAQGNDVVLSQEESESLSSELGEVAQALSRFLGSEEGRSLLQSRLSEAAPKTGILSLDDLLGRSLRQDQQPDVALDLAARLQEIEARLKRLGLETPRVDLKVPVEQHREALAGANEVYVAVAPLVDEDEVESIIAYSNGEQLTLDPQQAPETPTVVVLPGEGDPAPSYPLPTSEQPLEEERTEAVDDYVGISQMLITDESEGWTSGDPEIYARIIRYRFDPFQSIVTTEDFPGVNNTNRWYWLGDPNGSYEYVDAANYSPVITVEVWESDAFVHGDDDFMGGVTFRWQDDLGFGGYKEFSSGTVRMMLDRD